MILAATPASSRVCILICIDDEKPAVADSLCQAYERVIRAPTDSAEVNKMARGPKSRVARNDALYRCKCEGWKNPICDGLK